MQRARPLGYNIVPKQKMTESQKLYTKVTFLEKSLGHQPTDTPKPAVQEKR